MTTPAATSCRWCTFEATRASPPTTAMNSSASPRRRRKPAINKATAAAYAVIGRESVVRGMREQRRLRRVDDERARVLVNQSCGQDQGRGQPDREQRPQAEVELTVSRPAQPQHYSHGGWQQRQRLRAQHDESVHGQSS